MKKQSRVEIVPFKIGNQLRTREPRNTEKKRTETEQMSKGERRERDANH